MVRQLIAAIMNGEEGRNGASGILGNYFRVTLPKMAMIGRKHSCYLQKHHVGQSAVAAERSAPVQFT